MKRKSFREMECPIAQTLEVVGEWWTPLILREVLIRDRTKFDEIQNALGIAPTVLANRLSTLVSHGLLERRSIHTVLSVLSMCRQPRLVTSGQC